MCLREAYKEDQLKYYNISLGDYENPFLAKFKNLTYLYTIPYDNITLSQGNRRDFNFNTLIILRNKKALHNKFKFKGSLIYGTEARMNI